MKYNIKQRSETDSGTLTNKDGTIIILNIVGDINLLNVILLK
jgi:hypothetical protein